MKILITTDWYTPSVNGVVTSVLNLQKQLETAGHEVRVLTLAQNREQNGWFQHSKREGSVWYLPSVGAGKIYPGARSTLGIGRQYLKEMIWWKPDVVHSQCEFTTFWFARKIAAHRNPVQRMMVLRSLSIRRPPYSESLSFIAGRTCS